MLVCLKTTYILLTGFARTIYHALYLIKTFSWKNKSWWKQTLTFGCATPTWSFLQEKKSFRGLKENYMESGLYWKVIWEMVWKVQFLQFFLILLFGQEVKEGNSTSHSSKQHGSSMQQIGQLLSCGFATRNTHHLMSENFYEFVLLKCKK